MKYGRISAQGFVAVVNEARVLKLVSIIEHSFFFTASRCRDFDRWLKECDFKNKQYTVFRPPESGRGTFTERAIEFSHSDMGFAFVKPERFWQKGTLKERFEGFKDCWDNDVISPNEYANMW